MKHALLAIALLLLLPAAFTSGVFGPSAEDAESALVPVVRLPLDGLTRAGSASAIFTVPATAQWSRLRERWGDPDYVIFGVLREDPSNVVPWPSLGVEVTASNAAGALAVEPARGAPYGYGYGADGQDPGLAIRPRPGDTVRLDFSLSDPAAQAAGEIVVRPEWDGMKDRLVGVAMTLHLRGHIRLMVVAGVLLLVAAALVKH